MVRAMSAARLCGTISMLGLTGCMGAHRMTQDLPTDRTCPVTAAEPWYVPAAPEDHARLERWCRTVGHPVVRPLPSGAFPDLIPGDELTVLSWNVAAGGGDLVGFLEKEASVGCAGAASRLRTGAGHVAVLLQEAFRRSPDLPDVADPRVVPRAAAEEDRDGERLDVIEVADRCGLSLVYVAAARNGFPLEGHEPEDRGVAILTTLPLAGVAFIELPYEAARRVAVAAIVGAGAGPAIRLVNVHLISAAPPSRALATGNGSRVRQGLAVGDAVRLMEEALLADGVAGERSVSTLLAGDFNTWSEGESTLRRLRELFPDSPPPLGLPTRGAFPTDHMLFRRGAGDAPSILASTYARIDDRYHSDHHGLRIRVRFAE